MSGSRQPMTRASSHERIGGALRVALSALFLLGCINASRAQSEPPLDVPIGGTLGAKPGEAIPLEGWLLYPSIRMYSAYSDNLFNSPQNPISAWGSFGLSPSLSAEWSNGIHTTTLNANVDREVYPTDNEANKLDWNAGFTQKYEALRDLTFRLNGNVAHATDLSGLQNSIPQQSMHLNNRAARREYTSTKRCDFRWLAYQSGKPPPRRQSTAYRW